MQFIEGHWYRTRKGDIVQCTYVSKHYSTFLHSKDGNYSTAPCGSFICNKSNDRDIVHYIGPTLEFEKPVLYKDKKTGNIGTIIYRDQDDFCLIKNNRSNERFVAKFSDLDTYDPPTKTYYVCLTRDFCVDVIIRDKSNFTVDSIKAQFGDRLLAIKEITIKEGEFDYDIETANLTNSK